MNTVLDQVRAEYQAMTVQALTQEVYRQGFDPDEDIPGPPTKEALVDFLMAVEEFACFH